MTALSTVFVEARLDTSKFGTDVSKGFSSPKVAGAADDAGKVSGGKFSAAFAGALDKLPRTAKGAISQTSREFRVLGPDAKRAVHQANEEFWNLLADAKSKVSANAKAAAGEIAPPFKAAGKEAGKDAEKGLSDGLSGLKEKVALAGAAAAGALTIAFAEAVGTEAGADKLAAQLGLNEAQSKHLGATAGRLYSGAYGDSLEGVNVAIRGVIGNIDGMQKGANPKLQSITASVLDIAQAFDQDSVAITRAAGQMVRTGMAKDAKHALDIITVGFQQGADKSEDFLDTLNEYGTQFRKLGINGKTAMGILSQGLKGGARDADIVADSFKEFSLRTQGDLVKSEKVDGLVRAVLTPLGVAFRAAGFDALDADYKTAQLADTLQMDIAGGGKKAKAGLDVLLDGLRNTKNPLEQSRNGVALFGTQYEDMGAALTKIDISKASKQVGDVGDAASDMGGVLADNASTTLTTFWRSLKTGATDILGGTVIPKFQEFTGFLNDNKAAIQPLIVAVAALTAITAAHAAVMAVTAAGGLAAWIKGTKVAAVATKVWAAGQWVLNAAMNANPIGIVVLVLAALVAAVVIAYKKSDTFRKIVDKAWSVIKKAVKSAWENTIKPALTAMWKFIQDKVIPIFKWLWDKVVKPVFKAIGKAIGVAWGIIRPILHLWWAFLKKTLIPVLKWLWEKVVKPVFTAIGKKVKDIWNNWIKPAFENLREGIGKVKRGFETGVTAIRKAWDKLKSIVKKPVNFVINLINDHLIDNFNKVAAALGVSKDDRMGHLSNFDSGGYTGPGPRKKPAGIVHADEFVVSSPARRKIEARVPGLLDEMNHGKLSRLPGYFLGGGVTPMAGTTSISQHSGYGWAKWAGDLNGAGDDTGKTVRAWKSGIVAAVQHLTSSYGNNIRVNHAGSERTLYAHLSRILVNGGQKVGAGQKIGEVGSTGNSTGPHLHFELAGGSNPLTGGTGGGGGAAQKVVSFLSTLGSGIKNAVTNPLAFFKDKIGGPIKGMLDRFGNSKMAQMVAGVPRTLIGAAADKIKSLFGFAEKKYNKQNLKTSQMFNDPGLGPASVAGGSAQAIVKAMNAKRGWGSQWGSLYQLVQRESGWNPNAANPTSSARGLFQKMTSVHGPIESTVQGQAKWGLNYIGNRYGGPNAAWAHSQATGWYDGGGVARGRGYIPKGTAKPERVLSPRQTESFDRLVDLLERRTLGGGKVRLVVRGREFDAYIEDVADGRIGDARANERMRVRGGARI